MDATKTIEEVISLTVTNGTSTNFKTKMLGAGKIVGVCAYFSDVSAKNPGFVRASIKDANGYEVSQMQNIENYRSRETEYLKGIKPIPLDGGTEYTVTILASDNFTSGFLADFIFVYEQ